MKNKFYVKAIDFGSKVKIVIVISKIKFLAKFEILNPSASFANQLLKSLTSFNYLKILPNWTLR